MIRSARESGKLLLARDLGGDPLTVGDVKSLRLLEAGEERAGGDGVETVLLELADRGALPSEVPLTISDVLLSLRKMSHQHGSIHACRSSTTCSPRALAEVQPGMGTSGGWGIIVACDDIILRRGCCSY